MVTEEQLKKLGVPIQTYHWTCHCKRKGTIRTRQAALAPLVRLARANHDKRFGKLCKDVDIEEVATTEQLSKQEKHYLLGEGFC